MSENENKPGRSDLHKLDINEEAAFKAQIAEDLKNNAPLQEYLTRFRSSCLEDFFKTYINEKYSWYKYSETNIRNRNSHDLHYINTANYHLQVIQQKKLFDLQCLWRAEKVTIPGIEICHDFMCVSDNILNCNFIEPVSEEDVEMYQQYLLSPATHHEAALDIYNMEFMQHEDLLLAARNDEEAICDFPEWYEYHNVLTGNGTYLNLPDIRGRKEEHYRAIHFKKENEESNKTPQQPYDSRPFINVYEREIMDHIVEQFEDLYTKNYYRAYRWSYDNRNDQETMENIMDILYSAEEHVPVEGHYDWKEALRRAAYKYEAKKVAETLPEAFAQYQLNRSMNIAFPHKDSYNDELREIWASSILSGRRLSGEPEDFNL